MQSRIASAFGRPVGTSIEDHEAGYTFDASTDRRTVSGDHDAVAIPMPDMYPIVSRQHAIAIIPVLYT